MDLGTKKSLILTIQACQDHTYFQKILKLGETHQLDIIGIGKFCGLSNFLQPTDPNKPALLTVSNYLDAWPDSVITVNATEAIIYEPPRVINKLPTSKILEALPALKIIAVFRQIGNIYMTPSYTFLYDRPTISSRSSTSPIFSDLDKKIHIQMMTELPNVVDALDALLTEIVSMEQTSTSVTQIGQSAINYVSLTNKSVIEVNLVERRLLMI